MTVLTAARVVTGHEVHSPGWVQYRGDRIVAVGPGRPATVDRDLGAALVVPGFVDVHVHGGGGGSFTAAETTSALRAVHTHRRHGTTTTMASLVTAAPDVLLDSVSMLAELVEAGAVAGVHLEGPSISARRRGAHDPAGLREPDPAEIARLLATGRGAMDRVFTAAALGGAPAGSAPRDPRDPPPRVCDAALLRAARQTSVNPARALGWTDVGGLHAGMKADLVVLDPTTLHVIDVIRRGVGVGGAGSRFDDGIGHPERPPR